MCKVVALPMKPVAFCRFRFRHRHRRRRLCSLVKNSVRRITEEKKGECFILSLCNVYLTLGGMAFPDRLLIACFATSILNSIKLSLQTETERFNTSKYNQTPKSGIQGHLYMATKNSTMTLIMCKCDVTAVITCLFPWSKIPSPRLS